MVSGGVYTKWRRHKDAAALAAACEAGGYAAADAKWRLRRSRITAASHRRRKRRRRLSPPCGGGERRQVQAAAIVSAACIRPQGGT